MRWLFCAVMGIGLCGCAVVKPYERETLSRRCMRQDQIPLLSRLDAHREEYREASIGGSGVGIGGCGCN